MVDPTVHHVVHNIRAIVALDIGLEFTDPRRCLLLGLTVALQEAVNRDHLGLIVRRENPKRDVSVGDLWEAPAVLTKVFHIPFN